MSRYLFCPLPFVGELNPTVAVALALRARGDEVAFYVTPELAPALTQAGFRCFAERGGILGPRKPEPQPGLSVFQRRLLSPLRGQLEALGRVSAAFRPDVLVDTVMPLAPRLFGELRGVATASISSGLCHIPSRTRLFPFGTAKAPPSNPAELAQAEAEWAEQTEFERADLDAYNAARVALGLGETAHHPCWSAASRHLVLLPCPPELEYPRAEMDRRYWFVGPLIWQARYDEAVPAHVLALGAERPLLLVSQGTFFNDDPLIFRLAFAALADVDVDVLALTVRNFETGVFGALPGNVTLEPYVPFSRIMRRVRLMINHGGTGAVHCALSHGVPVIALPLDIDHYEMAARVAYTGAGLLRDVRNTSPAALRCDVLDVLRSPSFAAHAARLERAYAGMGGAELAADLLQQLAVSQRPVLRPHAHDPFGEQGEPSGAERTALSP